VDAKEAPVYLRVTIARDANCQFAYSYDNQTFTSIGQPFRATGEQWTGAKVGLFASAPTAAVKTGYADFDWFRVTSAGITP
jgi:hypothetical protein